MTKEKQRLKEEKVEYNKLQESAKKKVEQDKFQKKIEKAKQFQIESE